MQFTDLMKMVESKSEIEVVNELDGNYQDTVYTTDVPEKTFKEKEEEYLRYLNMKDPNTGKPFAIPLLDFTDPEYSSKYVDLMKMKEYNPEGFKKIMEWN